MLDYSQLNALLADDDQGTIEGAARALRVSSFAISQRISQLEKSVGVPLIERGRTQTTDAGKILCDHAREVVQIEGDLVASHLNGTFLDGDDELPIFRVALTEEAITGWFRQVLNEHIGSDNRTRIDVTTSNPDRSTELMQSGHVVAGVSTSKDPINGFKVYSLGAAHYVAAAGPAFIERHFGEGVTEEALATAPCFRYCHNDSLASAWVEQQFAMPPVLPLTKLPDMQGALSRVLSGEAWVMIEQSEANPLINDGRLIELIPGTTLSQPLYWHVAVAMLDTMAHFTKSVRDHAR